MRGTLEYDDSYLRMRWNFSKIRLTCSNTALTITLGILINEFEYGHSVTRFLTQAQVVKWMKINLARCKRSLFSCTSFILQEMLDNVHRSIVTQR